MIIHLKTKTVTYFRQINYSEGKFKVNNFTPWHSSILYTFQHFHKLCILWDFAISLVTLLEFVWHTKKRVKWSVLEISFLIGHKCVTTQLQFVYFYNGWKFFQYQNNAKLLSEEALKVHFDLKRLFSALLCSWDTVDSRPCAFMVHLCSIELIICKFSV